MAPTVPAAFDPKPRSLWLTGSFTADSAVLRGQVVSVAATGESNQCTPSLGTTEAVLGVALNSASSGEKVSVAMYGSVVKVCAADENPIEAGQSIKCDTTAPGCVLVSTAAAAEWVVGFLLSGCAANSTGYAMINPHYVGKTA